MIVAFLFSFGRCKGMEPFLNDVTLKWGWEIGDLCDIKDAYYPSG